MLLSFSVTNYRSFDAEQTFDMRASKRLTPAPEPPYCYPVPDTEGRVLRVAALYGANGAGKSNLVMALWTLRRLVLEGAPPDKLLPYEPFLLGAESANGPTTFDVQFLHDGKVFRYGIAYDAFRVHEEWLDVYEGTKERNLFSRTTDENGCVAVELGRVATSDSEPGKIKALAQVGARPNQPFMTEVVNLGDPDAQGPRFRSAVDWLKHKLVALAPDFLSGDLIKLIAEDPRFLGFARQFLREAGTGIAGLGLETRRMDLASSPYETMPPWGVHVGDGLVTFETAGSTTTFRRIMALHDSASGQPKEFPFSLESDGSKRLLHLLRVLYLLEEQGGVFVIDELERSIHPSLARKFIEFFLKAAGKRQSQLIFTTHETTLLDLDLLRRDGIWFAEKDDKGASQLYSLTDFKVRKDLQIEKGYLHGRFGAIPFLGGIDRLIEERAATEAGA